MTTESKEPVVVDLTARSKPRPTAVSGRVGVLVVFLLVVAGGYFGYSSGAIPKFNKYQKLVDEKVLARDPRNAGIKVSLTTEGGRLIYDLTEVSPSNSPADVFRVLLMTAQTLSSGTEPETFSDVILARSGTPRFSLSGSYFSSLGREYGAGQNPLYLTRTFPENVRKLDGSAAFPTWEGGLLGVTSRQIEDFNTFSRQWIGY